MIEENKIINFDLQGFPIRKMSIRDILTMFGAKLENGKWIIEDSDTLDIFPEVYEDDGMGYGINKHYITSINFHPEADYQTEQKYCTIFNEKEIENIELWKNSKFFPFADVKVKENGKHYVITDIKNENGIIFYMCKALSDFTKKDIEGKWFVENLLEYE